MKNSDYWKERFKQLEAAANKNGAEYYHEIEEQFTIAQRQIEKEVLLWYQRFATNNEVTMAEARQMLNAKQLAELKWNVKEYIKYGEENALDGRWMKQLENASSRFHITRLEALKLQTQQVAEVLYGNQTDGLDAMMKRVYLDGYYHTAFEVQKGFNVGWDIAGVDQSRLEKIISKPWAADGKNFSDRIWSNKKRLINEVHTQLTQTCILGKAPDDAIKNIAKKMGVSKSNAGRLVMTESAYFASASQKDCFNELDVEKFEILATLDSHTSAICQELDGKVFDMKEYAPGVTAPPFHVWCRSTTIPYFDDDDFELGKRAARGEDGKTYYVPDDVKYPEWKKNFVDGGDKDGLKVAGDSGIIESEEAKTQALRKAIMQKHKGVLTDVQQTEFDRILLRHDSKALTMYDRLAEQFGLNNYHYKKSGAAYYPNKKSVLMDINNNSWEKAAGNGRTGAWKTKFHEEFHQLDHLLSQTQFAALPSGANCPYKNSYTHFTNSDTVIGKRMIESIDADVLSTINSSVDWRNQGRTESGLVPIFKHSKSLERLSGEAGESLLYFLKAKYNTQKLQAQIYIFTDAVGLTTKNRISPYSNGFWGHNASYNKARGKDGAASETWATFGSLFFSADDEAKYIVKELMPKTWETYESVLNEILDYTITNKLEYK